MKIQKLVLLLALTLMTTLSMNAQSSKPNVEGKWQIKSLNDSGKMIDMSKKETTVEISTKAKSILLYIGCNRITANFEFITADQVKPFQLASTRKSCHGDLEALESTTRYALEQTNSVRKNGARIEFYKDNELLMVLERPVDTKKKK